MDHALASANDFFTRQPMRLKNAQLIAGLLGAFSSLAFADKTADVSDDFIEYLGQMEDRDDNWSDFADQARSETVTTHEQSSAASSASSQSRNDGKKLSGRSQQ